jgi:hypothetical protein
MSQPGEPIHVGEFVLHGGSAPEAAPSPPRPPSLLRKFVANVAAIAVVLAAVVVGAGADVAYRALSGGGPQPDKYAPASSFAFAKVDLDPSAGEKVAAYRFARRFPNDVTKHAKNSDDLRDHLLKLVFQDSSDPKIDYDKDIKPWLGSRVGVAGFLDHSGDPQALGIIATTDTKKARTSLERVRRASIGSAFAYDVKSDYALIADGQAVLNDAEAALAKGSLAKTAHYRADTQRLGGGQLVTAWADLDAVAKISSDFLSSVFGSLATGGLGITTQKQTLATPALPPSTACIQQLQRVVEQNPDTNDPFSKLSARCRQEFRGGPITVKPAGSVLRSSMTTRPAATQPPTAPKLTGRLVLGVHLHSDLAELVVHLYSDKKTASKKPVRDLVTRLPNDTVVALATSGVNDLKSSISGDTAGEGILQDALSSSGLRLNPDELLGALGDTVVLAVGNVPTGDTDPDVVLRTHPDTPQAARRAIAAINKAIADHGSGTRVISENVNGDVVVSNSPSYAGKVTTGGDLGDQKRFTKAVGPLDGNVVQLGYVDLRRILDAQPDHGGAARALSAAGFAVTDTDGDYTVRVRVVVG